MPECSIFAGVDEVGRGAWAGPVSVGIACASRERLTELMNDEFAVSLIDDSKKLKPKDRVIALNYVAQYFTYAVGSASARECDEFGMISALKLASTRAIDELDTTPSVFFLDGNVNYLGVANVINVVKGDTKLVAIAAASVAAKVSRDTWMVQLDSEFPFWNFASNKGYPSVGHRRALGVVGLSSIHRVSWSYVDTMNLRL